MLHASEIGTRHGEPGICSHKCTAALNLPGDAVCELEAQAEPDIKWI